VRGSCGGSEDLGDAMQWRHRLATQREQFLCSLLSSIASMPLLTYLGLKICLFLPSAKNGNGPPKRWAVLPAVSCMGVILFAVTEFLGTGLQVLLLLVIDAI
jgi:hypothetical protein